MDVEFIGHASYTYSNVVCVCVCVCVCVRSTRDPPHIFQVVLLQPTQSQSSAWDKNGECYMNIHVHVCIIM